MQDFPLLEGLHHFQIINKETNQTFTQVARNSSQAWRKFCTQHFGVLKPSRKDYTIHMVNHDK